VNNPGAIEYAGVQIWVDQYIDFSDPTILASLCQMLGAGTVDGFSRVPFATAQAAFGAPDSAFDGGPTTFINNTGTAGPVSVIGAPQAFNLGPYLS
jgi:hypothetical protein